MTHCMDIASPPVQNTPSAVFASWFHLRNAGERRAADAAWPVALHLQPLLHEPLIFFSP